jgi:type IV pilus assembly protein PilM
MANLLGEFKKAFSGLFGKKHTSFVGVDIGTHSIKIVQFKKETGRIVLETYGEVALGPYAEEPIGSITNLPPEKLGEALVNIIEQANVNARHATIAVPSASSLIFVLRIPFAAERQSTSVIRNEARKYIPVPLSEVSLDWWVIPENEVYGNDSDENAAKRDFDALVAVVRNDVLERFKDSFKNVSTFDEREFEIETFSAIRGSLKNELVPTLLVDLGASGTRMSIIEYGVVRKFHSVNRGSAYITKSLQKSLEISFEDAESLKKEVGLDSTHENKEAYEIIKTGIGYVLSEMHNVVFDYEKEHRKPINKIILTGGGAQLQGLIPVIEERYKVTTTLADPFSKVLSPDFLEEVLAEAGPEFAVACGLALRQFE